jgi:peptidoglycan/xylan/chitin deacetylase (PgdA/CDA1 family)
MHFESAFILQRKCHRGANTALYKGLLFVYMLLSCDDTKAQQGAAIFSWPNGKQAAISLSFDDARESQVIVGTDLLDRYGIKATFFVLPASVEKQLEGWKKAVANGHEIGNHSLSHPCSKNFSWSRENALEDYTRKAMRKELKDCNKRIEELLHVKAEVYAYPCGQKFVGRGIRTKSYVPLVSKMFVSGRGWLDEAANDPVYCNFGQLTGVEMDGKSFDQILPLIEDARKKGLWIVFAGHETGDSGEQTTRMALLKQLAEYVQNPANGIWVAPVGTVTKYIQDQKKSPNK